MARLLSLLAVLAFLGVVVFENVPRGLPLDQVVSLGWEKDDIQCTGVKVSDHEVLTAAHCLNGDEALWVNRRIQGKPVRVDKTRDMALLELPKGTFKTWASLSISGPMFMDELLSIGFPLAERLGHFVVERGEFMGRSNSSDTFLASKQFSLTTISIYPGNSGGPIWKWEFGKWRLVGIANAISAMQPFGWSVPPQLLTKLSFIQTQIKEFLWSIPQKEGSTGSTG